MYLLHDGKHVGGLQVGGGVNSSNALSYIDEGASHVIVTSVRITYVYLCQVEFLVSPHFIFPNRLLRLLFLLLLSINFIMCYVMQALNKQVFT